MGNYLRVSFRIKFISIKKNKKDMKGNNYGGLII